MLKVTVDNKFQWLRLILENIAFRIKCIFLSFCNVKKFIISLPCRSCAKVNKTISLHTYVVD